MNDQSGRPLTAPEADRRPVTFEIHGIERVDEYHWLRADNWQEVMREPGLLAEDIRDHLLAENEYQAAIMAPTGELQNTLFEEMKGRIKQDDSSVLAPDGDYAYQVRYVEGGEQPRFVQTSRDGNSATTLLDGDKEAAAHNYFRIGAASHSPDHKILAWSADTKGSEYFELKFRDIATGIDSDLSVPDTAGGGVWSADSTHMIYTKMDDNHRPSMVMRHKIGTDSGKDKLIYEENDPGFFVGVGSTQSNSYILIDIHDHESSEVWLMSSADPSAAPQLIAARETGVEYSVDEGQGTLYILTNVDDAKDFKIVTAQVENPGRAQWNDLVPHESGRLILSHCVYNNHLVWLERRNGLPRIVIHRLSDGEQHAIDFDEEAYSLGLSGGYEFDTATIRFTYSSMTTPSQTFDYNMNTRQRDLLKSQEVPSGHDVADYVTKRLFARSHDGVEVPVTILFHKDTELDGTAPCLLYGYGSYGISIPASFNTNCLSLVDRGFIYAIAHVRGGKDLGFSWYDDGKRENKTNTFLDFIAVADHLVEACYTNHNKIIAQGGSAGGMLMGAVVNMAPEKFGGIIAEVPFVDVLNTMLDDTLPLTPPEWPEWGNPIESREDYERMAAYSPYDQVSKQPYPEILALAGLADPRVTYWEPAKWVARLRLASTSTNPVLLKTNMEAGHGGKSGRFARLEEVALVYAFAVSRSGG